MRKSWRTTALSALAAGLTTGIAAGLTLTSARAQETGDPNAIADAGTERGTETAMLPTVTVEASGTVGFFSEPVAQTAGSVMRTDTPIVETPRSVNVVTQQQMQERGARNVTQALQYIPGVVAGTYGLDNRSDWAKVRGFEPAPFEDGMRALYGYYNNTRPETFLLDSVAVLKGPSGLLFGNGSVGGIINTTSKLPDPEAPGIVQLEVGSHNLFQAGIDTGGRLDEAGRFTYRLVAFGRDADGQVDYSRDDAAAIMPSIAWSSPDAATKITLLGLYQKVETSPMIQFFSPSGTLWSAEGHGNGDFLDPDTFVGEPGFDRYDAERRSVLLLGEHRLNDMWSFAGRVRYIASDVDYRHAWWAYDNYDNDRYNPDGTINREAQAALNDSHSWTGDAHARADFSLGPTTHTAIFGASFTNGRFNDDSGVAPTRGPIDPFNPVYTGMAGDVEIIDSSEMAVKQTSVYAQDRISYGRATLDLGLRHDWIETDVQTWNPANPFDTQKDAELSTSAALLYRFDNGIVPYLSYSESFFQEVAGAGAGGTPFEPTRGTQYEAGVKYQPSGTTSLFTIAAFEITKSNMLEADPQNPMYSRQTGQATSRGVELEARANWGDFSVDAGYAYTETEDANGNPFQGVPEHQASAWLGWAPSSGMLAGFDAGVGVRYLGETVSPGNGAAPAVRTPGVALYDAMVGYQWDGYRVQVSGRNLADKTYTVSCTFDNCFYGETRTVGLTLTAAF